MADYAGFGVAAPVAGFRGSRAAPRAIRGHAATFSETTAPLPPIYPPYDLGDVLARLQGAAVRCVVNDAVYVPFFAVSASGLPVRGLTHVGTSVALFSSASDTSPLGGGVTTISSAASGDIVEIDINYLPGAYAYRLSSNKTTSTGFVRIRIINNQMIPITVTVQVEPPPVSAPEGTVDLTPVINLQQSTIQLVRNVAESEGRSLGTILDVQQTIARLGADLSAAVTELDALPAQFDDLENKLLGRWKIITSKNVLVYLDEGLNVLKAFSLYNDQGVADSRKVFKRVPLTPQEIADLELTEQDKT